MTTHSQPDVIVIGAGVSGLIAARTLQATEPACWGWTKGAVSAGAWPPDEPTGACSTTGRSFSPRATLNFVCWPLAAPWLGSVPVQTQLHRWRYSLPLRVYPERCLALREPAPLVFAGDAFGGPRVEGAALSGMAAGVALAEFPAKTLGR